jgi:hypothetical protein
MSTPRAALRHVLQSKANMSSLAESSPSGSRLLNEQVNMMTMKSIADRQVYRLKRTSRSKLDVHFSGNNKVPENACECKTNMRRAILIVHLEKLTGRFNFEAP